MLRHLQTIQQNGKVSTLVWKLNTIHKFLSGLVPPTTCLQQSTFAKHLGQIWLHILLYICPKKVINVKLRYKV